VLLLSGAGEMALVASVLGTSAAQQQLVPALMRVYGQADFVVGLDVDKDDYDKFSVSFEFAKFQAPSNAAITLHWW
jgi:hypothetical protein